MKPQTLRLAGLEESLAKRGITRGEITSVSELSALDLSTLSEKHRAQLRFAPTNEVVRVKGSEDLWFRSRGFNFSMVFILLPGDLVLLTAEYVTGAEFIVISPCTGGHEKGECPSESAIREAREESGIRLTGVVPLSTNGLPTSSRKSTERGYPFLGIPELDGDGEPVFSSLDLDHNENLLSFLMPLADYWSFINGASYGNSVVARDCGYAALRHLGRIQLV